MLDSELTAQSAWKRLDSAWVKAKGCHRLIRATSRAYLWLLVSPILPRIALSAFMFSQPFLIETTVSLLEKKHDAVDANFGAALIGAFLLVYLGIAVSFTFFLPGLTNRLYIGIKSCLLETDLPLHHDYKVWPYFHPVQTHPFPPGI